MLPLNLLRVFHAVARERNVLRASETLFISQPAVSNALKKLQSDIGVRLFNKEGRSLVLTDHGRELYRLTERMFALEEEMESYIAGVSDRARCTIHVGLVTIYERFGIEEVLRTFSAIDPALSVSIHSGNSRGILEMLVARKIDMGICGDVIAAPGLRFQEYRRHRLFLVAPEGHRLYDEEWFTADDIREERMVLKEAGSSVRHTLDAFFEHHQVRPQVVMELSNLDSILNLVQREECITFLPDLSVQEKVGEDNNAFSLARHTGDDLFFRTYVAYHKDGATTEHTGRIIDQFSERVRDLAQEDGP